MFSISEIVLALNQEDTLEIHAGMDMVEELCRVGEIDNGLLSSLVEFNGRVNAVLEFIESEKIVLKRIMDSTKLSCVNYIKVFRDVQKLNYLQTSFKQISKQAEVILATERQRRV